jgi:GNAT superfamily N-acetyltransferase
MTTPSTQTASKLQPPRAHAKIRPIGPSDYECVSEVICRCLTEVNIRDYGEAHIAIILPTFASPNMAKWLEGAAAFVAIANGEIVATGTLRGHEIQTVFVDPSRHGMGYGKLMMRHLEELAKSRGATGVSLRSSITSKVFYERIGYQPQADTYGAVGGQMILMTKKI